MAALEAGDVIAVAGQAEGPFEITEIRDGLARRVVARAIPPPIEVVTSTGRGSAPATAPAPDSDVVVFAAHLPPLPDDLARSRLVLAAFADPWPGPVSMTAPPTGDRIARLRYPCAIGELTADLAPGEVLAWDETNTVSLRLYGGHLSSRDDPEVLGGANRIAVQTDDGGWEVVGFAEAALVAPNSYVLSRLLRGQQGSDASRIAPSGAKVVVLDGRVTSVPVPRVWLGATVTLTAYGPRDAEGTDVDAVIDMLPVLPLAPVDDVLLTWTPRNRGDGDSWVSTGAPLDYAPEAYRVTILDDGTPVRTFDVSVPTATYAAADQTGDFGSLPDSFDFSVAQLSATLGPGVAARGEFHA
jgi:hypothetical protein